MRSFVTVIIVSLVSFVAVSAQDLSEFDNKKGVVTVKTECFVQDCAGGEQEEGLRFEHTRYYGVEGEIGSKISKQGVYVTEAKYTHEFDEEGRVTQRTKKETWTAGKGPTHTRATLVWEYTYDDVGTATVVCKEEVEKKDEDDPDAVQEISIMEIWVLDSAGRLLEYSRGFVDDMYRVVFERDEKGRLLTKTESASELTGETVFSKETFTYRDDGTLKESENVIMATGDHRKKQYDPIGKECAGQIVNEDGKTTRQWTVTHSVCGRTADGSQDTTTYKIYGEDPEKLELQVRYVVTTTNGK